MLAPGWVYWTICALSIGVRSVVGDEVPSQSICLARDETDVQLATIQWPTCVEDGWMERKEGSVASATTTVAATATDSPSAGGVGEQSGQEDLDTESPLDNANFLSFEDWKKQNLAKVGQSVENMGGSRRSGAAGKELRGRPTGINNALDSLGEDTEIELDFGGFGTTQEATAATTKPTSWDTTVRPGSGFDGVGDRERHIEEENALAHSVPRTGMSRRKDAGTTCKERFNYASFDCAATVLKTNPEGMGSSSVLIENKDSYMLNECQAENKFLVLELCDDILVDTVVLANYEFFSSIFHTFRVSVSDRYPAKLDQWKELGVYEARNTREVQAFAVENPLIWARYLKIEFLTHYGHEFYCPLSLIRVHGTTMLEEYKHDGDVGRVEDEMDETLEASAMVDGHVNHAHDFPATSTELDSKASAEAWFNRGKEIENLLLKGPFGMTDTCGIHATSAEVAGFEELIQTVYSAAPGFNDAISTSSAEDTATTSGTDSAPKQVTVDVQKSSGSVTSTSTTSTVVSETAQQNATETDPQKEDTGSPSPEVIRSTTMTTTTTQPPSPNPTTQESFFKSVNKRLQMLESNSTLSLLYIEEQSRILRDAFNKVEKRQLAKTSTFLEDLNQTVLDELKQFREQYDQVWKTVLLEFEHQRIHHHQELYAMSGQLGVLADELVFQKRVAVVQSIMVLVCFGLILFSPRGVVGSYIDFPSVQNMVTRSYSMRSSSPAFESPTMSPSSTRPASSYRHSHSHSRHRRQHHHHRRNISEESQNDGLSSPAIAYSPPTPTSPTSDEEREERRDDGGDGDTDTLAMSPVESHMRSRSSPPVLKGCVDDGDADYETVESPASTTSPT